MIEMGNLWPMMVGNIKDHLFMVKWRAKVSINILMVLFWILKIGVTTNQMVWEPILMRIPKKQ